MEGDLGGWGVAAVIALSLAALAVTCTVLNRGPEDTFPIACMRAIATIYSRLLHRVRVIGAGRDPSPAEGPCILVSNHRSGVDPIILSIVTKRRVSFLMAREYYEIPILHRAFRALDCIPVNRDGNDFGATKAALKRLRAGKIIAIFPQGGIRDAASAMEGKAGVALLALRTGAPVVPVRIDGSPNLDSVFRAILTPSRTTVRFGPPIVFERIDDRKPSRPELEEVTSRILNAISGLGATGAPESPAITGIAPEERG